MEFSRAQPRLAEAGVTLLAVVNTTVERARLYLEYRPTPVIVLADPDLVSHRAFGVPAIEFGSDEGRQWPGNFSFKNVLRDARQPHWRTLSALKSIRS